jgi:hypothetical protein
MKEIIAQQEALLAKANEAQTAANSPAKKSDIIRALTSTLEGITALTSDIRASILSLETTAELEGKQLAFSTPNDCDVTHYEGVVDMLMEAKGTLDAAIKLVVHIAGTRAELRDAASAASLSAGALPISRESSAPSREASGTNTLTA